MRNLIHLRSRNKCNIFSDSKPLIHPPIVYAFPKFVSSVSHDRESPKSFQDIPGPSPSLPYIGTGWIYLKWIGKYQLDKLHDSNLDKYHLYGPIVKEEYQRGILTINLYDPADFERVFKAEKKTCPMRPVSDFIRTHRLSDPNRYPNVGLANMLDEEWAYHRDKLTPTFMRMGLASKQIHGQNIVGDYMVKYIMNLKSSDKSNDDAKNDHPKGLQYTIVDDIQDLFYRFTIESIMQMSIGQSLGCFESAVGDRRTDLDNYIYDASRLVESAKIFFNAQHQLYYGAPTWKIYETKPYKMLKSSQNEIHDIISKYVDPALDVVKSKGPIKDSDFARSSILETLYSTSSYSDLEIKSTITDFIGGGIFTAANALTITLYHLALNQRIQQKLYEEIKSNMSADQETSFISCNQLEKLKLLKACIKESSRLAPTVPGIARYLADDLILSNYNVPKDTLVFCNFMITCRLEKYFSEPDKYLPERWMNVERRRKEIHPYAMLPFGFGRRSCIGREFAKLEMNVAVAKLISKFRIELVDDKDSQLGLKYAFIVIPEKPVRLKFYPRL